MMSKVFSWTKRATSFISPLFVTFLFIAKLGGNATKDFSSKPDSQIYSELNGDGKKYEDHHKFKNRSMHISGRKSS